MEYVLEGRWVGGGIVELWVCVWGWIVGLVGFGGGWVGYDLGGEVVVWKVEGRKMEYVCKWGFVWVGCGLVEVVWEVVEVVGLRRKGEEVGKFVGWG